MTVSTTGIHSFAALNTALLNPQTPDDKQIRAKVKTSCCSSKGEFAHVKHTPGQRVTDGARAHKLDGVRLAQRIFDEEVRDLQLPKARQTEVLTSVMGKEPKEFLVGHSRRLAQATEQIKALHGQIGERAAELVSCALGAHLNFDEPGKARLRNAAELLGHQPGLSAAQTYAQGALFARLKEQLSAPRAAALVGAVVARATDDSAPEIDEAVAVLQAVPTMPGQEGLQIARNPFYKVFATELPRAKAAALAKEMAKQNVSFEAADLPGSDIQKVVAHAVRNMKVNPQSSAEEAFRNGCRYVGVKHTPASLEALREPREQLGGGKVRKEEARPEPAQLRIHASPPQAPKTGSFPHAPSTGVTPQRRAHPTQSSSVNA